VTGEREKHLRFMTRTRPVGLDKDAVEWALAEIEMLRVERDEWKHKWMALAQASLLAATIRSNMSAAE